MRVDIEGERMESLLKFEHMILEKEGKLAWVTSPTNVI
jgi:hypothetical protein